MSAKATTVSKLPSSFRFCISTAAHQVEGFNYNSDWWRWEQIPHHIKNDHTSEFATDSWAHEDEDLQNLKSLGVDTYRFSIEWAKIEPKPGEFNDAELGRYLSLIDRLKSEGIDSMVTLYHFTLPIWVADHGGWEWDGIADAFDRFTAHVAAKMGTRVSLWITLNEPMSIITAGYMSSVFPPGKNDFKSIGLPMANMVKAHAKSYRTLHQILDRDHFKVRVGLAHHLRVFDPKNSWNSIDRYLARKFDEIFNWAIPDALETGELDFSMPFVASAKYFIPEAIGTQDFFGLNYYTRDFVSFDLFKKPVFVRSNLASAPVSDLNWEIYPEGMSRLMASIHELSPKLPIWITENGLADSSDEKRVPFIRAHLDEVAKAIENGIPVEGYCHWTLNDNFEWAEGYTAHFGLYALEKNTLKRKPRPSAKAFSELVKETRLAKP